MFMHSIKKRKAGYIDLRKKNCYKSVPIKKENDEYIFELPNNFNIKRKNCLKNKKKFTYTSEFSNFTNIVHLALNILYTFIFVISAVKKILLLGTKRSNYTRRKYYSKYYVECMQLVFCLIMYISIFKKLRK